MSRLLFRLRNVPEEEAAEVRALLDQNNIDYFETFAGNWGISMPALWVNHDNDFEHARKLIDCYQAQRAQRIREEYELSRQRGEVRTLWHSFVEQPVKFVLYIALAGAVLFLSLSFYLSF